MNTLTSRLLLYSELGEDSILLNLSRIYEDWHEKTATVPALTTRVLREVKRILDLAAEYGFNRNLWQDYLTFLLLTNENSFSLACERTKLPKHASIHHFALADFDIFLKLFHFDFSPLEKALEIDCFQTLTHYQATPKPERSYNREVSALVRTLSDSLSRTTSSQEFSRLVTSAYTNNGVGLFGLNRAFRIRSTPDGEVRFLPVHNIDAVRLSDLVGYERQKAELCANTEAFLAGRPANNVLLYGDSGTGKSSSIKALINDYHDQGLRMVEIYKHQFHDLSATIAQLKNRAYRFILFLDDLSFEEHEIEYKFLKAVIEGGVENRPDNVLIYATSNRRHLIREIWSDRDDMEHNGDIHRSDTVEEKLSLAERFGLTINYANPTPQEYKTIVAELASRQGLSLTEDQLGKEASAWEIQHGGVSGRVAEQYVAHLSSKK
ncbi:MAG: ATP-binding protein [Victivallales bacterium]|nr:ATP-binding protein [Victivallales bacterium]